MPKRQQFDFGSLKGLPGCLLALLLLALCVPAEAGLFRRGRACSARAPREALPLFAQFTGGPSLVVDGNQPNKPPSPTPVPIPPPKPTPPPLPPPAPKPPTPPKPPAPKPPAPKPPAPPPKPKPPAPPAPPKPKPPAPAVRTWTVGYDPKITPVPGMSLVRMQGNISRGVAGLEKALEGTPYAAKFKWQHGAKTTFYCRDLRGTAYGNTYGITYPPHTIIINKVPTSGAKTFTWYDDAVVNIAIHELLHAVAPNMSHSQMDAYHAKAKKNLPPPK